MRKAQGLSLNFVIVGIIALVVLVVIILVFTGGLGNFGGGTSEVRYNNLKQECDDKGGEWQIGDNPDCTGLKDHYREPGIPTVTVPRGLPEEGKKAICCVPEIGG